MAVAGARVMRLRSNLTDHATRMQAGSPSCRSKLDPRKETPQQGQIHRLRQNANYSQTAQLSKTCSCVPKKLVLTADDDQVSRKPHIVQSRNYFNPVLFRHAEIKSDGV